MSGMEELTRRLKEQNALAKFPIADRDLFSQLFWHEKDAEPVAVVFPGMIADYLMKQKKHHNPNKHEGKIGSLLNDQRKKWENEAFSFLHRAADVNFLIKTVGAMHVQSPQDRFEITGEGVAYLKSKHPTHSPMYLALRDIIKSWWGIGVGIVTATSALLAISYQLLVNGRAIKQGLIEAFPRLAPWL